MANKKAEYALTQLKNSITNTLELLQNENLISYYNPLKIQRDSIKCGVTWPNHISDRLNTEKHFGNLNQYKFFLKNNTITALLKDASILKASYFFNNQGLLTNHSLLYWPCPFLMDEDDLLPPLDIIEYFESDPKWAEYLRMRSPIRFDFDYGATKEGHPTSHLHMQSSDCRIHVPKPVCFNQFITYIFQYGYPEIYSEHTFWDELEYTIKNIKFPYWEDIINKNDVTLCWKD